jgi:hypothetical protein
MHTLGVLLVALLGAAVAIGVPYAVNVPVADLRSATSLLNVTFAVDPNQQSQLLYAESVLVTGICTSGMYLSVQDRRTTSLSWLP